MSDEHDIIGEIEGFKLRLEDHIEDMEYGSWQIEYDDEEEFTWILAQLWYWYDMEEIVNNGVNLAKLMRHTEQTLYERMAK